MRTLPKLLTFFFTLSTLFCATLTAKPDVEFTDSDTYDGAYLRHEFEDEKIRFILTKPVLNINIANNLYDYYKLLNYIKNIYVFPNKQLRDYFVDSMTMSVLPKYRAKLYLEELQKILAGFSQSEL